MKFHTVWAITPNGNEGELSMQAWISKSVAATAFGLGMLMSQSSMAAIRAESSFAHPSKACQLSVPTVDTKVRPRATGYRNEGTSAVFVICGYELPTNDGFMTRITLGFASTDGASHTFNCTAVNGITGFSTNQFVTKSISVPSSGYTFAEWLPADFGGTTDIPQSYAMSVTCPLPPGTSIIFTGSEFPQEIGT